MAIDLSLPLRAVQALFAIIVLGTSGYGSFLSIPESIFRFLANLFPR
jgi:hypothetical protein